MTVTVPSPSARGKVRRGLRTSAAAKVMSCQESAENNDPDCVTQMAANNPKAVVASSPTPSG